MKTVFTILLSIMLALPTTPTQDNGYELTVQVEGIRNRTGYIARGLFDRHGDFPEGDGLQSKYVEVKGSSVEVVFKGLKEGEYAIAVMHDENGNEEMDYAQNGMPKEGYGFSLNAEGEMGPPSFGEASFKLTQNTVQSIDLIYLLR